ncbi:hypothetical protein Scep_005760 [Stephania cephalantha]|uniref:Malonyl-CoA:ACP transacylase (MAT) domain-containing protein n=1 Tax=Stephania cephalantha TaxID=152367 RepID=A0AAP0KUX1_9MAGN
MHAFPLIQRTLIASQSLRFRIMSTSILPSSIALRRISIDSSNKKKCNSRNLEKSRVFMSVSVGSRTAVDDALFAEYKPSCAFLFPGQGAQAVGMGKEALNVPAAADLYRKANEILGFDLLDICTNGPKEKLDSTVISQVRLAVAGAFHTRFMNPAVSRLEAALATTEIRTPRIPVISNVDAQPHGDPDTIKNILARQVTSPVQWETTVKTLLTRGLKKSYELGPGKVIAGIVKRMDKAADIENIGA